MKAFIDRIEDNQTVVVVIPEIGQLIIPKKWFKFKIYEGMHLSLELRPDKKSEIKTLSAVKNLQQRLMKKSI